MTANALVLLVIPHRLLHFGPAVLINLAYGFVAVAIIWQSNLKSSEVNISKLSFQKYAVFWVHIEDDIYQIGLVGKLFNANSNPYLVKSITIDVSEWALFPRGGVSIQRYTQFSDIAETIEDNYIKGNSETYLKKMLPVRVQMKIISGAPPEFLLRDKWDFRVGDSNVSLEASFFSVFPRVISTQEWSELRKPPSAIDVESFYYKKIPQKPKKDAPQIYSLLYSPAREATIDDPYFAFTPLVKGEGGVMTFVAGPRDLPDARYWRLLGHTYAEAWRNTETLAIYNSVFPPGADGLPRAIGFFAGQESRMTGDWKPPLLAPTTIAASIIEYSRKN